MLVIRRHAGQSIVVGDGVEIQVMEAGPNRVKLGIVAPREVSVMRKEVGLTREANFAAARAAGAPAIDALVGLLRQNSGARQDSAACVAGPAAQPDDSMRRPRGAAHA